MNTNDDKTILGESDFNIPNNEQNSQSDQNKQESTQKEYAKNTVTSKTDKNKVSKGAAIGGAAAVGVAAAVGGVAAGTAYSEEIKEKYNELFAEDTKAVDENTAEVTDTSLVTDETTEATKTDLDSDLSKTEDFVSTTHHSSYENELFSDPLAGQDSEIRVELPPDEFGTVHAINLVDVDHDGVADKIEEITTIDLPEWDEGGYLTSSGYEPDPNMIIEDEPLPEGYFEPEGMPDFIDPSLIDDTTAYEPIDYANFEDGTIQPIDDALIASDESVAGDYIIDPSITEDFTLDGELQSEDYTASTEDYSLDSDLTSDEFTASTEDYSLDSDLSSEDYSASTEDYSLDSDMSSEDYLASNEDYQIELENTDFDTMDNTDFSSESFDTGFSDDLI